MAAYIHGMLPVSEEKQWRDEWTVGEEGYWGEGRHGTKQKVQAQCDWLF